MRFRGQVVTKVVSTLEDYGKGPFIVYIEYGLEYLEGNKRPYFFCTGQIWKATTKGNRDRCYRDCISCGCIHDTIAAVAPNFRDLIALHLSDDMGVPMYSMENGWYWYENKNINNLSTHLRITKEKAVKLIRKNLNKDQFRAYIDAQIPRWKKERNAAIVKHNIKYPTNWTKRER